MYVYIYIYIEMYYIRNFRADSLELQTPSPGCVLLHDAARERGAVPGRRRASDNSGLEFRVEARNPAAFFGSPDMAKLAEDAS